jgi:hypothetical protein
VNEALQRAADQAPQWDWSNIGAAFYEGCCPEGHRLQPVPGGAGDCLVCGVRILCTSTRGGGLDTFTLMNLRMLRNSGQA